MHFGIEEQMSVIILGWVVIVIDLLLLGFIIGWLIWKKDR